MRTKHLPLSPPPRRPLRRLPLPAVALLASAALALSSGCGGSAAGGAGDGGGAGRSGSAPAFTVDDAGAAQRPVTVLDPPFTKPDLVLTDTHGATYDLRAETEGRPTLIYFGYTHCPDVCPLTMSNIALAKRKLPAADRGRLRVVFVTTDPERDTPAVLADWLRPQDPDFVGLTGPFAAIQAAARQLGVTVEPPQKDKDGSIVSTHGTTVVAFSPKTDGGYLLYGEQATVDDYTQDLPDIVAGRAPKDAKEQRS